MLETTLQVIEIFVMRFFVPATLLFTLAVLFVIKTENHNARHRKTHPRNQIKEFDLINHFKPQNR